MTATTRLHITPFRPDLLPAVLGIRLLEVAQNVSYQSIETFPENSYGFVELPEADARKLISKLNGAILRGRTMKVEEARPSKRSRRVAEEVEASSEQERSVKRSKKSKKDLDVLEGHELDDARKVKRGWTDSSLEKQKGKKSKLKTDKKSKSQSASKYSEKDELLFRTNLPPSKKDLDTSKKRSKGRKDDTSPTLVHEFEKTAIQPKFLRDATSTESKTAEYVDGKGWVDKDGTLIEEEPANVQRSKHRNRKGLNIALPSSKKASEPGIIPSSDTNDNTIQSTPLDDSHEAMLTSTTSQSILTPANDETSSSGTSDSDSDSDNESQSATGNAQRKETLDPPATPPTVHPLEALFKRPKPSTISDAAKPSLEVETSFSFFGKADDEIEDELPPMPMTPFTSHDISQRTLRSAAPTPDTAHPSRFTSFAAALGTHEQQSSSDEGKDPSETSIQNDREKSNPLSQKPQSEFEKRFWAERGQNNRAWKARNRTARKEQRQMENKMRRSRQAA